MRIGTGDEQVLPGGDHDHVAAALRQPLVDQVEKIWLVECRDADQYRGNFLPSVEYRCGESHYALFEETPTEGLSHRGRTIEQHMLKRVETAEVDFAAARQDRIVGEGTDAVRTGKDDPGIEKHLENRAGGECCHELFPIMQLVYGNRRCRHGEAFEPQADDAVDMVCNIAQHIGLLGGQQRLETMLLSLGNQQGISPNPTQHQRDDDKSNPDLEAR
ncbi:MAG: hypothetical protein RBS28_12765 [Rhodocyclaceae bacterium]|nr:hypothetical protein [Rhodocyclaceae bacterium]